MKFVFWKTETATRRRQKKPGEKKPPRHRHRRIASERYGNIVRVRRSAHTERPAVHRFLGGGGHVAGRTVHDSTVTRRRRCYRPAERAAAAAAAQSVRYQLFLCAIVRRPRRRSAFETQSSLSSPRPRTGESSSSSSSSSSL